jgi:predicted NAD/FAD-binding protein
VRIAVVGAGIAGMASAWLLSRGHEVVLFEAGDRLGGHTHTHDIELGGRRFAVDTGFIVCNPSNYPLFTGMLAELGVATQPTTMTFALRNERSGLEYNAGTNGGLFLQKRRVLSPRHWRMILDILRFYRSAPALLANPDHGPSLGEYLERHGYSAGFRDDHIVPMASALWSSPSAQVLQFPAKYLVAFMANHHMLQVDGRPQWRVVKGGSSAYVGALERDWTAQVRLSSAVRGIRRHATGVDVATDAGTEVFDHVVLACHSDQSLALLADPSDAERDVLGAMPYQRNETVLHTDPSQLPRDRRAWAAWNAIIPREEGAECTVSYCMNLLQSLDAPQPFVVTLNRTHAIDPARILRRMVYHHPVYTHASVAAQKRRAEINGVDRTWYCGAYWGWGFHEDGMRSAVEVAAALGERWQPRANAA